MGVVVCDALTAAVAMFVQIDLPSLLAGCFR
jgi:hypothetical protein